VDDIAICGLDYMDVPINRLRDACYNWMSARTTGFRCLLCADETVPLARSLNHECHTSNDKNMWDLCSWF